VRDAQNVGVDGGRGRLGHAPDDAGVNKHVDVAALPAGCVQRLAEGLHRNNLHYSLEILGRLIKSSFKARPRIPPIILADKSSAKTAT
jgi:hypothetical protein